MRVLAINCGSSTLKFQLFEFDREDNQERRLANGLVDEIGTRGTIYLNKEKGESF